MARAQDLDVVVFGATGFTGELVCEYIVERKYRVHWAVAGRSRTKLTALLQRLTDRFGPDAVADVEMIEASSFDRKSLAAMVKRTKVVISTVGPYLKYGDALVAVCAESGTHYVDITGETGFVRRNIDNYHELARETGAKIVSCCGYDSVPSDMGQMVMVDTMLAEKKQPKSVQMIVGKTKGGVSGGTLSTVCNMMDGDPKAMKEMMRPTYLNAIRDKDEIAAQPKDQKGVVFSERLKRYTVPFFMAVVNTRIVRRSNELRGIKQVAYSESMGTGTGVLGYLSSLFIVVATPLFLAAMYFSWTRWFLFRFLLPNPGQGPTREAREAGSFTNHFFGETTDGTKYTGLVHAKGDPGYKATSMMLTECALCLALQPERLAPGGGVLTTASALGSTLLARLRVAGMTLTAQRDSAQPTPASKM